MSKGRLRLCITFFHPKKLGRRKGGSSATRVRRSGGKASLLLMAEARGDSANTEVVIDVRMGRVGGGGSCHSQYQGGPAPFCLPDRNTLIVN